MRQLTTESARQLEQIWAQAPAGRSLEGSGAGDQGR